MICPLDEKARSPRGRSQRGTLCITRAAARAKPRGDGADPRRGRCDLYRWRPRRVKHLTRLHDARIVVDLDGAGLGRPPHQHQVPTVLTVDGGLARERPEMVGRYSRPSCSVAWAAEHPEAETLAVVGADVGATAGVGDRRVRSGLHTSSTLISTRAASKRSSAQRRSWSSRVSSTMTSIWPTGSTRRRSRSRTGDAAMNVRTAVPPWRLHIGERRQHWFDREWRNGCHRPSPCRRGRSRRAGARRQRRRRGDRRRRRARRRATDDERPGRRHLHPDPLWRDERDALDQRQRSRASAQTAGVGQHAPRLRPLPERGHAFSVGAGRGRRDVRAHRRSAADGDPWPTCCGAAIHQRRTALRSTHSVARFFAQNSTLLAASVLARQALCWHDGTRTGGGEMLRQPDFAQPSSRWHGRT